MFKSLPSLFLFAAAPFCHAAIPTEQEEKRLCALEQTLENSYNAPYSSGRGVCFSGEVLYWTAKETGIAYALKVDNNTVLYPDILNYDLKEPEFDWDFGFRVGTRYTFQRDGWDLGLCWSHFFTRAEEQGSIGPDEGLLPIFASPNFITFSQTASDAEADWKLNYNQVDLALGRGYYIGKYFVVRPYAALSGLWIDQHYDLEYERKGPPIPGKDHVKLKNAFSGAGFNGGIDLLFTFRHGWSIYGKGTVGIYSGHFDLKSKEKYTLLNGEEQKLAAKHSLRIGAPTSHMAIGFRWEHPFARNRYSFSLQLLWEHLYFFNQNQFYRFITPSSNRLKSNYVSNQGDLAFQGGSFSLAFGF